MPRIYLDNAATTWPKPEAVWQAVDDYQRRLGAPAGRGAYHEAAEVERLVDQCRSRIRALIGAEDPRQIVFTLNGTDSLNQAIHGCLRPGDHVITSVCEHNSVLRPLRQWQDRGDVRVTYVRCDGAGYISPDDVRKAIQPRTRLIALLHASNVTGAVQPLAEVGAIAREHDVLLLVDAAQSLGHVPVDVAELGCDLLAAPGHKGLYGPLGTGVLYLGPGVESELVTTRQGGTGTRSDEDIQPMSLPDRYESGNLNVPGIVGLNAGVAEVQRRGLAASAEHERELTERLLAGLAEIRGVTLYGPRAGDSKQRVGVVSFNLDNFEPQELAALLDSTRSIQVRAGIHCAPRMHEALGTSPRGTVRFSIGLYNTPEDIDAALSVLREIAWTG
ncbi:MAG TPA: aminotransferase class V-fold PLP-dependent enzyme [Pirellulaceae bacterium]|nr:aminotransferase class V-fold PLP-dependent enzyme [Pirellulaceae bacterium]